MKKRTKTANKIRRQVTVSVCLPASVTMIVSRDPDPDSDDWVIESIEDINCEASARGVTEHMRSADSNEMVRLADAAKDLP